MINSTEEEYSFKVTLVFWKFYELGLYFSLPERKEFMEHMGAALVDQEIISVARSRFYTCLLHNDEIVDKAIEKVDNICQKVE